MISNWGDEGHTTWTNVDTGLLRSVEINEKREWTYSLSSLQGFGGLLALFNQLLLRGWGGEDIQQRLVEQRPARLGGEEERRGLRVGIASRLVNMNLDMNMRKAKGCDVLMNGMQGSQYRLIEL